MPKERQTAARIVHAAINQGRFADRELEKRAPGKALVQEISYGTLRMMRPLNWIVDQYCKKAPEGRVSAIILTALYQMFYMDNQAPYAVINDAVDAARDVNGVGTANFVNAILREAQRNETEIREELAQQRVGIRLSHPDRMIMRWQKYYGVARCEALCEWNNKTPHVIIRPVAGSKIYMELLEGAGFKGHPHPSNPDHFIELDRGQRVRDLPGFSEGAFTVQDPATAHAIKLLNPQAGDCILDACAAPGGKARAIAEQLGSKGMLVAMDVHADRLPKLRDSLKSEYGTRVEVFKGDAAQAAYLRELKKLAPTGFDKILLDVPCSNSGVLRRRPEARWRFAEDRLETLLRTQWSLVEGVIPMLRPGGLLVYSTCSLEREENEDQIERILKDHPGTKLEAQDLAFPPENQSDGAFCAAIRFPG